MIVRNPTRRRGDIILALDNRKIGFIAAGAVAFFVVSFLVGFFAGRITTGSGAIAVDGVGGPEVVVEEGSLEFAPAPRASEPEPSPPALPDPPAAATPAGPTATVAAAPPAPSPAAPSPGTAPETPTGRRYAIVAGSFPLGGDTVAAMADAERQRDRLRTRGFRSARIERITLPDKGPYVRIIAMEANYPSSAAAQRDVQSMIRRGDLQQGFALPLGPAR